METARNKKMTIRRSMQQQRTRSKPMKMQGTMTHWDADKPRPAIQDEQSQKILHRGTELVGVARGYVTRKTIVCRDTETEHSPTV